MKKFQDMNKHDKTTHINPNMTQLLPHLRDENSYSTTLFDERRTTNKTCFFL